MFKRPSLRPRHNVEHNRVHDKPEPGTFLHDIINPKQIKYYKYEKAPIYQKEVYLNLLKKNCRDLGIPYIEPNIPDAEVKVYNTSKKENLVDDIDKIYMKVKCTKNGTVKIKLITAFMDMYNKYYKHGKKPPIKTITNAYKLMGFSQEFIEEIQKKHTKKLKMAPIFFKKIESILTKEPVKKSKVKKTKLPVPDITDDLNDDENEGEDDDNQEDEGMDMEVECDDEICEDQEEYYSDGDE